MKATYEKPGILFESFTLSQSIATNCGVDWGGSTLGKPTWGDTSGTCGWDLGNVVIWVEGGDCTKIVDANTEFMGMCYNTPSGNNTIFSS